MEQGILLRIKRKEVLHKDFFQRKTYLYYVKILSYENVNRVNSFSQTKAKNNKARK